ncbi:MAG: CehA/McbA family metallohydrolase [Chloroflexota bacterium]|nr:CehA/McbA family metallohydrolase [Chloroflexota bacterium]
MTDPLPGSQLPRTFATWLRDNAPLSTEQAARLVALDSGRHPTLTELRFALGLELDLNTAAAAARTAWPARDSDPTDTDFARVLDAMYGALASRRVLRIEITDAGPVVSGSTAPIVIRDAEHLVLLPLADNRTEASVQFSAESHGEGVGGHIEPHRTGSALLDAGAMHPGSYLLPVLVTADGKAATIDLPIECRPSGTLGVRIIDDATGERVAARVYLIDDAGEPWPPGATLRRDRHGAAWFHADGSFTARVSGRARLRIVRGIEYEAVELEVAVAPDAEVEREVRLRRWSHMAADGWYSGDVHVHLHYGGEYELAPEDASLAQRAEDVNFLNMAVANENSGWVHDGELFEGRPHALSDESHILRWGEEYRNNLLGHMCMFGIEELVPPIYSGVPNSDHPHDLPANADAAAHCHNVGGTLSYAHPMLGSSDLDRIFAVAHMVDAKELPVDVTLGHIDAFDLMSYPGNQTATRELWYRLLNCGFRLTATAGTDTFMNHAMQGVVSNPPAGDRAFVRVDGAFTTESWCAGVRAGRSFVTNAPMLSLEVNGAQIGDEIAAGPGDVLHIEAEAGSHVPMGRIDLVVNGAVVAAAEATDEGRHAALTHELTVAGSCWIAVRVTGPAHPLVLDDALFAHTSPIYVTVPDAPIPCADDAAYFIEWIDRLVSLVETRGRFPSAAERGAMVAMFRKAQSYYSDLLDTPSLGAG